MKHDKKKNKSRYNKTKMIYKEKKFKSEESLKELKIILFIQPYEESYKEFEFTDKDMKTAIDGAIISLFGTINACKILYSLKEIGNNNLRTNIENNNLKEKFYSLKTKQRY